MSHSSSPISDRLYGDNGARKVLSIRRQDDNTTYAENYGVWQGYVFVIVLVIVGIVLFTQVLPYLATLPK